MKKGYDYHVIGLDVSTGKERVEIKISSRYDLIKEAEQRRQFRILMKDMVWTPTGFEPLNPEYLARGIAAREEQRAHKETMDLWGTPEFDLEKTITAKYYEIPVYCPLKEALEFAEKNQMDFRHRKPSLVSKIAGWFKR